MQKPPLNSSASLSLMYAASFLLCIFFGALLRQIGTPGNYVNLMMFALIVGGYIFTGLFAKTMILPVFQYADRTGRAFYIGQSIAAGLISSGVFIFLAGDFYTTGTDAITIFSGLILGTALMTILFSAPINRSSTSTLVGLIIPTDGSKLYRFLVLMVIVITSMLLLYVQFSALGMVSEAYFGISENIAILLVSFAIGFSLILGGMQSLSIIRMIAYPILVIAFMVPVIWIAFEITGNPIPQLSFGAGALQAVSEIDQEMINAGFAERKDLFNITSDGLNYDIFNHFSALICIAFGTAAMPHLLQHFTTLKKATNARKSGVWGLGFLLIVLTAIPAVAAFIKLDIYSSLLGLQLSELDQEGSWLFELNENGSSIISICGAFITSASQALSACGQSADYFISSKDIGINPDMLLLSSSALHGLPSLATTLLATGALLAIWTTADGLVFVCAHALAEGGYRTLFRPNSPMGSRLFISRVFLVLVIAVSAYLILRVEIDQRFVFSACFALLTASLFPALVCRIWFKQFSQVEVITGMLLGFALTSAMLWLSHFGMDIVATNGDEIVFNIPQVTTKIYPLSMGLIGMVFSFGVTLLLSTFFKARAKTKNTSEAKSDVPA